MDEVALWMIYELERQEFLIRQSHSPVGAIATLDRGVFPERRWQHYPQAGWEPIGAGFVVLKGHPQRKIGWEFP
jgi:hypothetical protein